MDKETWKQVIGFEGYYEVSDKGNIKALSRIVKRRTGGMTFKEKIKRLNKSSNGYLKVALYKDGAMSNHYVHRLVACSFLPNPFNKPDVDHIDTDRSNNKVENLRWCTRSENNRNPITYKRMSLSGIGRKQSKESIDKWRKARDANGWKINQPLNNGKSKAVAQINPHDNSVVRTFPSMQEVKRQLSFYPSSICDCCKGKKAAAYGFIWKYV